MAGDVRSNMLDDLLDAERHFRQQAEYALRDLQAVLTELALKITGPEIEAARRLDPYAPENWGAERWRQFFSALPMGSGNRGWNEELRGELERLRAENRALRSKPARLASASAPALPGAQDQNSLQMPAPGGESSPAVLESAPGVADTMGCDESPQQACSYAHSDLLGELRALRLPDSLPVRFQDHFPRVGLNLSDWQRQLRRRLYVVYLLSRGLDIRLEIDHLISQVEGIGARSGALRKLYDSMVERNLASREVLAMSAPNTSLAMLQLTQDGSDLCQALDWPVVESERQRIQRLHEGDRFPQHSLAILIFAMHARLRGLRVEVLPDLPGVETRAAPDVAVIMDQAGQPGEKLYVEVELSLKELDEKWRNLDRLQGRVALCARNTQNRARLVGDCKLKNLHGLATDLESLITCKVPDISTSTALWVEEW
jgi:hypothetical protein